MAFIIPFLFLLFSSPPSSSLNFQNLFTTQSTIHTSSGISRSDYPTPSRNEVGRTNTTIRIPFVVQNIGRGNKREIDELTRLCIDVFFNDNDDDPLNGSTRPVAPWKALQLAYLRGSQSRDILARNMFKKNLMVDIIVARRVYFAPTSTNSVGPEVNFVRDADQVLNEEYQVLTDLQPSKLVLGEIIGYCEVIEKNFGLGKITLGENPLPYLANLSVAKYARQSGVASKLLDVCEEVVRDWNAGHSLMVLQVEEDNLDAIRFYKKRGWQFCFADPACRRYDTGGFFLKESRVTKYSMMKRIHQGGYSGQSNASDNSEVLPAQKLST